MRPKSRQNFSKRGETRFATLSARRPWANGTLWRTGAGRGGVVEVGAGEDDSQAHRFIIYGSCFAICFAPAPVPVPSSSCIGKSDLHTAPELTPAALQLPPSRRGDAEPAWLAPPVATSALLWMFFGRSPLSALCQSAPAKAVLLQPCEIAYPVMCLRAKPPAMTPLRSPL